MTASLERPYDWEQEGNFSDTFEWFDESNLEPWTPQDPPRLILDQTHNTEEDLPTSNPNTVRARALLRASVLAAMAVSTFLIYAEAPQSSSNKDRSVKLVPYVDEKALPPELLKKLKKKCLGSIMEKATCYDWAGAYQAESPGFHAEGVSVKFSQPNPRVSNVAESDSYGDHSVAEIWASTANYKQAIEVGWMKNSGDKHPWLFATDWVNNKFLGFANSNTTGFINSHTRMQVGDEVKVGKSGTYGIKFVDSNWEILYDNQVVGVFPESIWKKRGTSFTKIRFINVYGEVASDLTSYSPTQMGNGLPGYDKKSARVSSYKLFHSNAAAKLVQFYGSDGRATGCYTIGNETAKGFTYGGAGYTKTCIDKKK